MGGLHREHLKEPPGPRVRNYGSIMHCNDCENEEYEKKKKDEWVMVKPDGGWGWLVVFGVALCNMTTQSLISVFGLLFMRRLPELGIDTSGFSLMVSIQITILNLSGLVTGPILKHYTPRQLTCVGGVLVIVGLYLTGYANSLFTFIFTYSVLTGLGIGFLSPSTFVAINSYFTTWRARAVGLAITGTSLGQMLLPLLVRLLLDEFGFRGTVLILSALSSHNFIGAALFQPVEWHMKRRKVSQSEEKLKNNEDILGQEEANELASDKMRKNWLSKIFGMDWNLLKNLSFLNLIANLGVVYTANIIFQMFLPFFLESAGYTRENIAICMSVLSGADIIGRLIVPSVTDIFKLRTKTVLFLGAGLSAVFRSSLVWYSQSIHQLYPTLAIATLCGIVRAAIICNFNLCVSDETPPDKLPSALGLFMVFKGLSVLIFGPLIGFIRDYTGSYSFSIHIISVLFLILPFLIWLIEFICLKRQRRTRGNPQSNFPDFNPWDKFYRNDIPENYSSIP